MSEEVVRRPLFWEFNPVFWGGRVSLGRRKIAVGKGKSGVKLFFCPWPGMIGCRSLRMNAIVVRTEERLIDFAASVIRFTDDLPGSFASQHLAGQLVRSGTAPALLYGEAQAAESRQDFIHKMKVALKELKESYNCMRIIRQLGWNEGREQQRLLAENNELIAIFVRSIDTARKNLYSEKIKQGRERPSL